MSWTRVLVVFLLTTFLILTFLSVAENAAVRRDSKEGHPKDVAQQVFMPGSDASNFFKRRNRRSPRYYDELQAEYRRTSASGRRRKNNEEYRNEYDKYIEEDHEEQTSRYKRVYERIRALHYNGYNPYYYYWYY